jgi:hypothetical protein
VSSARPGRGRTNTASVSSGHSDGVQTGRAGGRGTDQAAPRRAAVGIESRERCADTAAAAPFRATGRTDSRAAALRATTAPARPCRPPHSCLCNRVRAGDRTKARRSSRTGAWHASVCVLGIPPRHVSKCPVTARHSKTPPPDRAAQHTRPVPSARPCGGMPAADPACPSHPERAATLAAH